MEKITGLAVRLNKRNVDYEATHIQAGVTAASDHVVRLAARMCLQREMEIAGCPAPPVVCTVCL